MGEPANARLATWRIEQADSDGLAIFSSASQAERYAESFCTAPWRVFQPERAALIRLLIDCYQAGIRQLVLDPGNDTAQHIFLLAEVLKAARESLT